MKTYLQIPLLAALMLISVSCGDFGDMNVNPNNTSSVAPEVLLTRSLRSLGDITGRSVEVLYAQHFSETQYTEESRYQDVNFNFDAWYTGPLVNLQHIIDLNTDEDTKVAAAASGSNANQIAVARILKAFYFHFMTDRWGPIPYSQALSALSGGGFRPAYDSQESIYKALFQELKEAVAQMDGGAPVVGDFVLNGDMEAWKRFANSLRMVMALRLSEVDETLAKAEFASALSAGPVSDGNESILYPYLPETANQNYWYAAFVTRFDYAISLTLEQYMTASGDARLPAYADPAPCCDSVIGMPYGIANAGDISNDDISFPGNPKVRGQDSPLPIITYEQLLFAQAEAVSRNWVAGNARNLYEAAIKASWERWGVFDQTAYDAFIAHPDIAWDDNKALELIGNQKWVAQYLQGWESWAEWRRLGYPDLKPAPDSFNPSGGIPLRQAYPTSERDLNEENYNAAVSNLLGGGDDLNTALWWDK